MELAWLWSQTVLGIKPHSVTNESPPQLNLLFSPVR